MRDKELINIALKMQEKSYAPYSDYKVGAALLCADNDVITGCNVENVSFGATICAERSAFLKAISEGKSKFEKIAISVSDDKPGIPCGICLQFISEFVDKDFVFLCSNNKNEYKRFTFSQLLPRTFKANLLHSERNEL